MSDDNNEASNLPALPGNSQGWLTVRQSKRQTSLIDQYEQAHLALVDDPNYNGHYVALNSATTNGNAVEGSLAADKFESARAVREKANEMGLPLGKENLQTIANKRQGMLRRFGASTKQRRMLEIGKK